MAVAVAQWFVYACMAYALIGIAVALPFAFVGSKKIDPSAREGSLGFRLLIIPGCIALWPFVLRRWRAGAAVPPAECNAHRRAAATSQRSS